MATPTSTGPAPFITPPPGVTSDYNASNSLYNMNILTQTVCLGTTTILMSMRCAVRRGILKRWACEDWLCLFSWALFVGYSSLVSYLVKVGGGLHGWDVTKSMLEDILYYVNMAQIVYSMSILVTKCSLLYLYMNIFAPSRFSKNWWSIVIVMIANGGFYTGLMFGKIFQCDPREAIWNKSVHGQCLSLTGILDASGGWNTMSDIVVLSLPLLFIWKLKLSKEKRYGVIAIFAVGIIAPIFSIVGVVMRIETSSSPDLTYYQPRILFFAEAEITAGIICTCLPILPRLFKWVRGEKSITAPLSGDRSYQQYYAHERVRRRTMMRGNVSATDKHFLTSEYMELDDDLGSSRLGTGGSGGGGGGGGTNSLHGPAVVMSAPPRALMTGPGAGDGGASGGSGRKSPIGIGGLNRSSKGGEMGMGGGIWKTTEVEITHDLVPDSVSEMSISQAPSAKVGSAV